MRSLIRVFFIGLVLSMATFSQQSYGQALTLQEAIRLGLQNNPRTQANALRLQAAFERLAAAKQSAYLPTAEVGHSRDLNERGRHNTYLAVNVNLFNGFADYYRVKTRECQYKLTEANYNSTNAFLQNTSGQIVGLVVSSYVDLIRVRGNLIFYKNLENRAREAATFAKSVRQQNAYENFINNTQITNDELENDNVIIESNYKAAVNQPLPSLVETFSSTFRSIIIPPTAEESFSIGLEKSPEILRARLALECQKLGYKASQASLYGARVDLGYYQEKNSDGSRDSQGSAQIRLTIPFDLGRVNEHLAEAKNISASELDLEGAIQDVDKDLKNTYVSLRSIEKSLSSYERINAINAKKIEGYLSRLSSLSEDDLDDLLSLLSTSQSYRSILNSYYVQAINLKYNIQRNIGTLFETNSVEVDALGGNVRIREGN